MNGLMVARAFALALTLVISSIGLAQEAGSASEPAQALERVNINRADARTLSMVLDGVGMARAEAIVTYRDENGDYASLEDLLMVQGIGEVTVRRNQDRIQFE